MDNYLPRILDKILDERLEAKGAVLIEGPKWCGKTTTAKQHAKSFLVIDEIGALKRSKFISETMPGKLLEGKTPRLIDEWQMIPDIWNVIRHEVDNRDKFGQFILTGSSVPIEMDSTMHSGIGRISRLYMRPMSLYESQDSTGEVSLQDLFMGRDIGALNNTSLNQIAFLICRGGWPKALGLSEKPALFQAIDYFNSIIADDISRVDLVRRDKEKTKKLLRSYARNVGTQSSLETIREDVAHDNEIFSKTTLYSYLEALRKIFVLEDAPAWSPNLRSKTAIRTTDTRYFVDPSIATAALEVGPNDLLNDLKTMGFLFENLCVRDLRVYADYLDGSVYHYRDKNNLECDAVVHLRGGAYGLVEIKLGGESLIEEGANNLKKLAERLDYKRMKKPAFLLVLCAQSKIAYKRKDGVYVVPISVLKP